MSVSKIIKLSEWQTDMPFYIVEGTTTKWVERVRNNFLSISPVFRKIVSAAGIKFILARRPPDLGLDGQNPTGDFLGRSDIEIAGFYNADTQAIIITRKAYNKARQSYQTDYPLLQMVTHEFIHALDDVLGISGTPEAIAAYELDKLEMTARQRHNLKYLLQEGPRGPQEAIAEIGSHLWTGSAIMGNVIEQTWPYLTSWLDTYFNHLEKNYDSFSSLIYKFNDAAAHVAEKAILQKFLIHEPLIHDVLVRHKLCARDLWSNLPADYEYDCPDYHYEDKKAIVRQIVTRQGLEEVAKANYNVHQYGLP